MKLTSGQQRNGIWIELFDKEGNASRGDVAPLPKWSQESLADCLSQLSEKKALILRLDWTKANWQDQLASLKLLPALSFGLESALLFLLDPLEVSSPSLSALLMGSPTEILHQAHLRKNEGYTSAKLKVNNLTFKEAFELICTLSAQFRLRIDVNRAWSTSDALKFFSQFPLDAFDYVEEPFANPHDLSLFHHPLAVDESFPNDLSLKDLETLPTLKALIYKPTIQGGLLHSLPLYDWTQKRAIALILSSSFESKIGLQHIVSMAQRLGIKEPIGIGTYHFVSDL